MCEVTDWLDELRDLKWAVSSLVDLFDRNSSQRQIYINASKGIESRIDWIIKQARLEVKRET